MEETLRYKIFRRLLGMPSLLRESDKDFYHSSLWDIAKGRTVLRNAYKQHSVVYSCIRAITDDIKQVPFVIYKATSGAGGLRFKRFKELRMQTRDGQVYYYDPAKSNTPNKRDGDDFKEITEGSIIKLFDRPNPINESPSMFWEAITTYFLLHGECDIATLPLSRDIGRLPEEMWPTDPRCFTPQMHKQSSLPYQWEYKKRSTTALFLPYQLIRPRLFDPDYPLRGNSPLLAGDLPIKLDWNAMLYNEAFFENDATPGGYVISENLMSEEERKDWLAGWNEQHQDIQKKFRWSLIEGAHKVVPITLSPKDMQFLQLRKFIKEELAMIYGVPLTFLSDIKDSNRSTDRIEVKKFWTDTLIPILRHLEDIFWSDFFQYIEGGKYWGAFDLANVEALQENFGEKLDQGKTLFNMGYPPNAINKRLELGMEELAWGDTVFTDMNKVPIQSLMSATPIPKQLPPAPAVTQEDEREDRISPTKLQAAQKWLKAMLPFEGEFAKIYKSYLWKLRITQLKNLEGYKPVPILEPMDEDTLKEERVVKVPKGWEQQAEIAEELLFAETEWNKRLVVMTNPAYAEAAKASLSYTANEVGSKTVLFDLTSPSALKIMKDKNLRITGTNQTLRDNLKLELMKGINSQETVSQLQARLKDVMNFHASDSRRLMVARTEIGSVSSSLRYNEMQKADIGGSSWVTAGDKRVRDSHLGAEREGVVPMGQEFQSTKMRYPLDPKGSADEIIACRCASIPER